MSNKLAGVMILVLILGSMQAGLAQGFDPNNDPNLLGYWAFDEGAGGTVEDLSGNGNIGILNGDPQWVSGYFAGGLLFDGTDDYVDTGNADNIARWTICCWVICPSAPLATAPTGPVHREQNYQFSWHHSDAVYRGSAAINVNGTWYAAKLGTLEANEWYHLAATYDGTVLKAYRDGKLITTTSCPGVPSDDTNSLKFGRHALAAQYFGGTVDEVRVYTRALTDAEIGSLVPPKLKARKPQPADGAVGVMTPLFQWTAGETAMFHDVYLGPSPNLTEAEKVASRQPFAMHYHVMGLEPGVTYHWRIDEIEADLVTIHTGDVWSFTTMPLTAWAPDPADGDEQVLLAPTLAWTAGQGPVGHHLYLGSDFDAVSAGAAETDMGEIPAGATTYQVTTSLEMDTVYYWRVDGTNTAGTVETGEVWSFTTIAPGPGGATRQWWTGVTGDTLDILRGDARFPDEPSGEELVTLMEGPVDWSDNYGSRIYGWLYPQASGDYTFWIASDNQGELWLSTDAESANVALIAGVEGWVPSRDFYGTAGVPGLNQQSAPVTLEAGQRYYIEALMNEGTGGDNIAVAWAGPGVAFDVIGSDFIGPTSVYPVKAFAPSPADGAVDTIQSLILSWSAGQGATQHAVYLGDDAEAVANADTSTADIFRGQQAATTYNTGPLEWGKTYYWRIDENTAPEAGRVWSFTTANFVNVEDFESYDDADNRIYQTWIDGVDNATGSYVGYAVANNGTFGETVIVHGGGQSMPLEYDNADSPFYSETERTFDTPQDWTINGVDALVLYIRGSGGNDPEPLYVGLEDNAGKLAMFVCPEPAIVTTARWTELQVPLSEFSDKNVNVAAVKKMYIGLGDRDAPTPGGAGLIFIDDIRVIKGMPPAEE